MRLVSQKMCCPRAYTPQRQGDRARGCGWHIKHSRFNARVARSTPLATYVSLFMCVHTVDIYMHIFCLLLASGWAGGGGGGGGLEGVGNGQAKSWSELERFQLCYFKLLRVSCRLNFRRKTKHPFGGFMQMPRYLDTFVSSSSAGNRDDLVPEL